ncbi:MAG: hypothetical protein ACRER5_21845, partial [Pseudomonas sp.]
MFYEGVRYFERTVIVLARILRSRPATGCSKIFIQGAPQVAGSKRNSCKGSFMSGTHNSNDLAQGLKQR